MQSDMRKRISKLLKLVTTTERDLPVSLTHTSLQNTLPVPFWCVIFLWLRPISAAPV